MMQVLTNLDSGYSKVDLQITSILNFLFFIIY